jgi:hypothetical protein
VGRTDEAGNGWIGRSTWLLAWVGLSLVGFMAAFIAVFIGGWFVVEAITGDADGIDGPGFWLWLTAGFTLAGAGWATAQWLLLRSHIDHGARWIAGGAAGFFVIAVLYLILYERVPLAANEVVHNLVGGAVMGIVQVPVVRRLTGRSRQWIAVTALAMLGAGLTHWGVQAVTGDDGLAGLLGAPVAAAITGVVLRRWTTVRTPAVSGRVASSAPVEG